MIFFSHRIQFHTFASSTLPCHVPLCQTVPLLPSVTQQQNVMEYFWEDSVPTAMPPTYASETVGQHNKIRDVTFGASLLVSGNRMIITQAFYKKVTNIRENAQVNLFPRIPLMLCK